MVDKNDTFLVEIGYTNCVIFSVLSSRDELLGIMIIVLISIEFIAFSFLEVLFIVRVLEMACCDLEVDIIKEVEQFDIDLESSVFEDKLTETERVLFFDHDFETIR